MTEAVEWRNRIVGGGVERAGDLVANPKNWRRHPKAQQAGMEAVLDEVGWVQDVIVNRQTGHLVDGHLRVELARVQGEDTPVPVKYVDLSEDEERVILATLDPLGAMAVTDVDTLAEVVQSIDGLAVGELRDLIDGIAEKEGIPLNGDVPQDPGAEVDRAEELREKWGTDLGQVWELGNHRFVVGDCTDRAVVDTVMQGERAQLAVTSPPYGVGKSYEAKGIGPWFDTVRPAIKLLCEEANVVVWNLGDLYSTGSQFIEPTMAYSVSMFMEQGYRPLWIRMWLKQGQNYGVGAYHLVSNKPVQQYEYVAAFGKDEDALAFLREDVPDASDFEWLIAFAGGEHRFVRRLSRRDRKEWGYSGVWQINTVRQNKDHPAMFPLELPERCIKMHSGIDDLVLDPFLGSGTTVVGCERLRRKGRGIELNPAYCAVALERLAGLGLEPRLVEG